MTDDSPPSVSAQPGPGQTATATVTAAPAIVPITERTITHEAPSDLPETNWFWRRVFAFTISGLLLYLVDWITRHSKDVPTIKMIAQTSLHLIGLGMLLYMAGASAEAITKLFGAIRTTRKEIIRTVPQEDDHRHG